MLQKPTLSVALHVPVASSQLSIVHARPSSHVLCVAQTAEALHTPQPAGEPSLQRAPVRAVQDVGASAGLQIWHALAGLIAPSA